MKKYQVKHRPYEATFFRIIKRLLQKLHIDIPLFIGLCAATIMGLIILYSASDENITVILKQIGRFSIAFIIMIILAQIHPTKYKKWAVWIFSSSFLLILLVLLTGIISKGAQRWLNVGGLIFQPSELMKLAVPIILSWYLSEEHLPPSSKNVFVCFIIIALPAFIIMKQPDLGTALIVIISGIFVLFLAGVSRKFILGVLGLLGISAPIAWHFMHAYQKLRVLTFLNPQRNPLGSGYHIIQSKIAIGSGGFFGKGYLQGTQIHLHFLPENSTDFIFGVCAEELGFIGSMILIGIFLYILGRGLYITTQAKDTFSKLLAGSASEFVFLVDTLFQKNHLILLLFLIVLCDNRYLEDFFGDLKMLEL